MSVLSEQIITPEQKEILKQLLNEVVSCHSFSYLTLEESKKKVNINTIEYCFDALSLCLYHCNLKRVFLTEFNKMLNDYYMAHFNRENRKELGERATLFEYLISSACPYNGFQIAKEIRPDFVLKGKGKRIGVEVVELTTSYEQILRTITEESFDRDMSAFEVEEAAEKKHGMKAHNYDYIDYRGSVHIRTTMMDLEYQKQHYAEQLRNKYLKYIDIIPRYDRFVILGDAQKTRGIAINSNNDVNYILECLRADSDLEKVSVVILWKESWSSKTRITQYDF